MQCHLSTSLQIAHSAAQVHSNVGVVASPVLSHAQLLLPFTIAFGIQVKHTYELPVFQYSQVRHLLLLQRVQFSLSPVRLQFGVPLRLLQVESQVLHRLLLFMNSPILQVVIQLPSAGHTVHAVSAAVQAPDRLADRSPDV